MNQPTRITALASIRKIVETARTSAEIPAAVAARLIRCRLAVALPDTAFTVTVQRGFPDSSIVVHWTDGPLRAGVESAVGDYSGHGFDSTNDLGFTRTHWLLPDGTATLRGSISTSENNPARAHPCPAAGAAPVRFHTRSVSFSRHLSAFAAARCLASIRRQLAQDHDNYQADDVHVNFANMNTLRWKLSEPISIFAGGGSQCLSTLIWRMGCRLAFPPFSASPPYLVHTGDDGTTHLANKHGQPHTFTTWAGAEKARDKLLGLGVGCRARELGVRTHRVLITAHSRRYRRWAEDMRVRRCDAHTYSPEHSLPLDEVLDLPLSQHQTQAA